MSVDEFSRDFEIVDDIVNRPCERLSKVRSRVSGTCYLCRRIDTSKLTKEQQQMLDAEIRLFQQLDDRIVTRYLRVLRNDEPGIIRLIMEYCDGGTLEYMFLRMRERRITCTEEKARALSSQIAHALCVIRSSTWGLDGSTIMGALTPKSVLLLSTGKIRLKGICSWHTVGQISISARADYMVLYTAPEVFTSAIYNEQSEVWALGCILYEALTSKKCFSGETGAILRHNIVNCIYDPLPNSVSDGMKLLLSEMLQPDYRLRPTLLDVRLSLKILSDAEKMHHWDVDIMTEADGHPTPVSNSIKKLIAATNTDIVSSLQSTSSPVVSSYIYTDLKTSKDSGNVYLAGRVVLSQPVSKDDIAGNNVLKSGLPTSAGIAYTKLNVPNSPTSNRSMQSTGIRSNTRTRSGSVVHTPSMSMSSSSMRHGVKLRSASSSAAFQSYNQMQKIVDVPEKSFNPDDILKKGNNGNTSIANTESKRGERDSSYNRIVDSCNLTISNLNVEQDCSKPKTILSEYKPTRNSVRSASVRLPSMSMTTKPANLQLTALHNATGGVLGIMKESLATKAMQKLDVDACGTTNLMIAAMQGNVSLVKRYISMQSGMKNVNGMTALMLAAERGHEAVIPHLLPTEGCMHVLLPDGRKGKTALMFAAINNHVGIVRCLLEAEACCRDENGNNALMLATKHQFTDVIKELVQYEGKQTNERGETALMMAAAAGDIDSIELLIDTEATLVTTYGWTALCFAVMNNRPSAVEALIQYEAGLQCFQQGCNGVTALMIAAEAGYLDIASMLIEKELLLRNSNGEKASDIAIKAGQTSMITLLENAERLLEAGL